MNMPLTMHPADGGFGIGPGAGHLIADLVTSNKPIFDPAPYNPARCAQSAWGKVADF